ncbi:TolC family protein [Roseateles sp. DB2]|uniref:TolC family protein n=1 Tax=Roseateles sp. DB2 TaxID=3453717 RepID=UPI003EECA68F
MLSGLQGLGSARAAARPAGGGAGAWSLLVLGLALALLAPAMARGEGRQACGPEASAQTSAEAADYSLDELARLAAERHPSVAAKRAVAEAAKADWEAARAQYLPTPSLQSSPNAGGGYTTVYALQQPLWTAGRLTADVEAASARSQSAEQGVLESRQNLGFAVANAYQALLQAQGRAAVWRELLDRMMDYRETLQRRIAGGVSAPSESELLQARQAQAAGQFKAACHSLGAVRQQLSSLVGLDLTGAGLGRTSVPLDLPELPALQALLEQTREHSPTLYRLAHDEEAARREAEARAAAQWPSLSLTVQRSVPHGIPFSSPANTVGLQLQFAPGAGLSAMAARRAAAAQVEAARAAREAARLELSSRVRTEYEELRSALARRDDVLQGIRATGLVLASYERLFVAGKRSWLDVMNAARELLDAQLSLADLDAQMTASRYRLELFAAEAAWMRAKP